MPHRRTKSVQTKETPAEQSFYQIVFNFTATFRPKIPEEFQQYMEKEIEEGGEQLATLVVSKTEIWQVEINKDEDGHLAFKDGWENFYAENTLNKDHVLVFSYHGCLRFGVDVFDKRGIRVK